MPTVDLAEEVRRLDPRPGQLYALHLAGGLEPHLLHQQRRHVQEFWLRYGNGSALVVLPDGQRLEQMLPPPDERLAAVRESLAAGAYHGPAADDVALLLAERARLVLLVESLTARVAAQSDALTRAAERREGGDPRV